MTQHGGHRRDGRAVTPTRSLALHGLAALAALAGWAVLVRVAIDAGRSARDGDGSSWFLLVLAALAAAVLLIAALGLGRRMLVVAGVLSAYQPKRARRP